ncbi:MAG: hypothetical protein HYY18_20540 [Planctomycetes bacterium]|nr:hypothetical protein [Planctomycetota bacterium]
MAAGDAVRQLKWNSIFLVVDQLQNSLEPAFDNSINLLSQFLADHQALFRSHRQPLVQIGLVGRGLILEDSQDLLDAWLRRTIITRILP